VTNHRAEGRLELFGTSGALEQVEELAGKFRGPSAFNVSSEKPRKINASEETQLAVGGRRQAPNALKMLMHTQACDLVPGEWVEKLQNTFLVFGSL
jgi:hypothetical protein